MCPARRSSNRLLLETTHSQGWSVPPSVPSALHVHPLPGHGGALFEQECRCTTAVTRGGCSVGVDDAPPGNVVVQQAHRSAHLPWTRPDSPADIAVGGNRARRDGNNRLPDRVDDAHLISLPANHATTVLVRLRTQDRVRFAHHRGGRSNGDPLLMITLCWHGVPCIRLRHQAATPRLRADPNVPALPQHHTVGTDAGIQAVHDVLRSGRAMAAPTAGAMRHLRHRRRNLSAFR